MYKPNISEIPIVMSVEFRTSKISKCVDYYLKLHIEALQSHIKDTADFIKKINRVENITEKAFLVSFGVKSILTNISNHEGNEAAKEALNSVTQKPIAAKVFIKFLFPILTLNNFIFNGIQYLQKLGFVMGTVWAPNYANILWENLKDISYIHVFKHFQIFIVDLLMISFYSGMDVRHNC